MNEEMKFPIKAYYSLAKPNMIYGNSIVMAAGFLLACRAYAVQPINLALLIQVLIGFSLVMASGCIFNNYIDRDIDSAMARTKERVLVKGLVSLRGAIIYGFILGLLGFLILFTYTNWLTLGAAFLGFFFYVVIYGIWKRRSVHGTIIGSISGAVPPLVGYVAVSSSLDLGAIMLFVILVLWQMPHFYAIAIYRMDDYSAASVPVLPIKKGIPAAKIYILCYAIAFAAAVVSLVLLGYAGYIYLAVMSVLSLIWIGLGVRGFWIRDDRRWARQLFFLSLIILMSFSAVIAIDVAVAFL